LPHNARDHRRAAGWRDLCPAKGVTDQARPTEARCYVALQLISADVERAMKHAEHDDVCILFDQISDPIVTVQKYAHVPM
jgi:hypothetical protein